MLGVCGVGCWGSDLHTMHLLQVTRRRKYGDRTHAAGRHCSAHIGLLLYSLETWCGLLLGAALLGDCALRSSTTCATTRCNQPAAGGAVVTTSQHLPTASCRVDSHWCWPPIEVCIGVPAPVPHLPRSLCDADHAVSLLLQHPLQVLEQAIVALDGERHLRDQHSINNTWMGGKDDRRWRGDSNNSSS